jgi:hypothetical protein
MVWRAADSGALILVTTSACRREAARALGAVVFGPREVPALIVCADRDRASARELARWCAWKRSTPAYQLSALDALGLPALARGGVVPPLGSIPWRAVLRAYGCDLIALDAGDHPASWNVADYRARTRDLAITPSSQVAS